MFLLCIIFACSFFYNLFFSIKFCNPDNDHSRVFIVLCPSPGCQIRVRVRVQVITSKSESNSESSPQSPSPSQKKKNRVRVTNLVVHIFNICLSSKSWKQTTKCIKCQSKQRNTARPLLLVDSGVHESRFLSLSPSPSQSEKNWTRVWVPTLVTQDWYSIDKNIVN